MSEYTYTTTHYYDRGVFGGLEDFTLTASVGGSGSFVKNADNLYICTYNYTARTITSTAMIDVTNLSTLCLRVHGNLQGSIWNLYAFLADCRPTTDSQVDSIIDKYAWWSGGPNCGTGIYSILPIDVSNLSGSYYLCVKSSFVGYVEIFEIYGETAGEAGGGEGVTSHKNIAEAYVIGLNKGRAEALELATQAYKDGYKLGTIAHSSGGGDDVDYPADTGTIIIDNAGGEDGDGRGTDPDGNVIDMGADGIWLTFGDGAGQPRKYIHVYLDGTIDEGWYNGVYHSYKNHVKADCYDSVTGLSAERYMLTGNGNYAWYTEYSTANNGYHAYITRIKVGSNGWVFADATSYSGDYPEPHTVINCYELCYVQYAEGYAYLGASTTAPEGVVTT